MPELPAAFLQNGLLIAGATLLLALGTLAIRRARRDATEARPPRPEELLADLEAAYRRGTMSEAEFQRIHAKLQGARPEPPPSPPAPPARSDIPHIEPF